MNRRKNLRAAASRPRENEVGLRNLAVSAALFVVTLFVYGQVWDFGLIVVDDPTFCGESHRLEQRNRRRQAERWRSRRN